MNCPTCGVAAAENVVFCGNCGENLATARIAAAARGTIVSGYAPPSSGTATAAAPAPAPAPAPVYYQQVPPQYIPAPPAPAPVVYGNFFARFFALIVDEFIAFTLAGIAWGIFFVLSLAVGAISGGSQGAMVAGFISFFLGGTVGLITYVLYFVKLETGPSQATFGKRMLGLKITNSTGGRISVGQSLGRLIIKDTFSVMFILLGFIIAAFTEKKQALHDFVASTYVVNG